MPRKQLKKTKTKTSVNHTLFDQGDKERVEVAPHVRTLEWNGLKPGDPVKVLRPGRRAQWKFDYTFIAHVSVQSHADEPATEYIDVLERPRRDSHGGKWRSFAPDNVVKP